MLQINRTKWKKIKKNYQRVMQKFTLDESNEVILVTQHYRKRLNLGDAIVCKSLPDSLKWCDPTSVCDSLTPKEI